MSSSCIPSRPSLDPHGYQPLVIDETVLSAQERCAAIESATRHPRNWLEYLTPAEIASFEQAIAELQQHRSPYWFGRGDLPAVRDKRFEMNLLGMLRAYARDKCAQGRGVWYGDGVRFWRQA